MVKNKKVFFKFSDSSLSAVVFSEDRGEFFVDFYKKIDFGFKEKLFLNDLISLISINLEKISLEIKKEIDWKNIKEIYFFFSPFFVQKKKFFLNKEEKNFFEFNNDILENRIKIAEKELDDQYLLLSEVGEIKANSYSVKLTDVLGKRIKKVEIPFFFFLADKKMVDLFVDKVSHLSSNGKIILKSDFEIIKFLEIKKKEYLFFNFENELKEILYFRDGKLIDEEEKIGGRREVVKKISEEFERGIDEAEFILNSFLMNKLNKIDSKRVDFIFEEISERVILEIESMERRNLRKINNIFLFQNSFNLKLFEKINKNIYFINKGYFKKTNFEKKYEFDIKNLSTLFYLNKKNVK